jgi:hypothetical protein
MALVIYGPDTYENRGNQFVRPLHDASSYSRPSVYSKDLKGCGVKTHIMFQGTAQFNSLNDCHIVNEVFVSISGGIAIAGNTPANGVNSMVQFVLSIINESVSTFIP